VYNKSRTTWKKEREGSGGMAEEKQVMKPQTRKGQSRKAQAPGVEWEKLRITNDFIFYKVMTNGALCKQLLQTIFPELNIEKIEHDEQKEIRAGYDTKSIRLDVYARDEEGRAYDVEMQMEMGNGLPRRMRYYGSLMDLQLIDKGATYSKLKESYVVFICPSDPFGLGRYKYTFRTICEEERELVMEDGTTKIILNASGKKDDVQGDLKAFLDYVAGGNPQNEFVESLEEEVKKAKKNRKWRQEYMTLLVRDRENQEIGERQATFRIADNLLKNSPDMSIETVIQLMGISEEQAEAYRKYKASNLTEV